MPFSLQEGVLREGTGVNATYYGAYKVSFVLNPRYTVAVNGKRGPLKEAGNAYLAHRRSRRGEKVLPSIYSFTLPLGRKEGV
jgi:hypothetical protein